MTKRESPILWSITQKKQNRLDRSTRRLYRELFRQLHGPTWVPQKTLRYL